MKIQISSLFALLLLFASPLTAEAQWVCSASHVSTVEFMPEVNVRRGDVTTTEALVQHLSPADQELALTEILDLAHNERFYCAHQIRVSFDLNADTGGYVVYITMRGPHDHCWEAAACSIRLLYVPELGPPPTNTTALAAVREAHAHGQGFCHAMLISCPGDTPPD